ncbi:DUF167 domain-containing protein [Candidatus Nomurabacteria bacterium]|nr:DUF167 domain-containing protein [Candidatus Nomurabacteria bacterium]
MYLKINVIAGAKRDKIEQVSADHFNITVRAKAEQNLANKSVVRLVAIHLNIPASRIRIVNGHHSPSKMLSVRESDGN